MGLFNPCMLTPEKAADFLGVPASWLENFVRLMTAPGFAASGATYFRLCRLIISIQVQNSNGIKGNQAARRLSAIGDVFSDRLLEGSISLRRRFPARKKTRRTAIRNRFSKATPSPPEAGSGAPLSRDLAALSHRENFVQTKKGGGKENAPEDSRFF